MSWDELAPPEKGAKSAAPVRVGMFQIRGGEPRLVVLMRREVIDLVAGGVRRFKVALGKVENRHLLRIQQADDGPFEAGEMGTAKGGGTFRILLAPNDRFPCCRIKAQEVPFKHDKVGKALLITLPSWAWDDRIKRDMETSSRGRAAA